MKVRLYLEICSSCNLKCKYCFEKDYKPQFIEKERLFKFLYIIAPMIDDVVITGGEPMLHQSFFEIAEYISRFTHVVITTNGTRVDISRIINLMRDNPNIDLQFSLDAIDSEFVDSVRGKGVFDKLMNTILQLQPFHSQLSISSTLTKQTPEMLETIYSFAKMNNITCYFPSILPYGALSSNWTDLMPDLNSYIEAEEKLVELVANDRLNIIHSNKVDIILSNYFGNSATEEVEAEYFVLKVDSNGHILTCPATDYSYICSRITDIDHIHEVGDLQKILQKYDGCKSAGGLDEKCVKCTVKEYCRGTFCGNCVHMYSENLQTIEYLCETFRYHYSNLKSATKE